MNSIRIVGLVLFAIGFMALAYGGFSYTKKTHQTDIGPLSLSVQDKERVNIPVWAGIAALIVGGALFFGIARR